jgi:hypothetical protein
MAAKDMSKKEDVLFDICLKFLTWFHVEVITHQNEN